MDSFAHFSACRQFRYSLTRVWDRDLPAVMFVGLNPSTADESTDDPTVRRCIGFARTCGFGRIVLTNLFAFRSTDPKKLKLVSDPIGPENDEQIIKAACAAARVLVAWGIHGSLYGRDQDVLGFLEKPYCLGITKNGLPKHPLYLAANTKLMRFPQSTIRIKSPARTRNETVRKVA